MIIAPLTFTFSVRNENSVNTISKNATNLKIPNHSRVHWVSSDPY